MRSYGRRAIKRDHDRASPGDYSTGAKSDAPPADTAAARSTFARDGGAE